MRPVWLLRSSLLVYECYDERVTISGLQESDRHLPRRLVAAGESCRIWPLYGYDDLSMIRTA